MRKLLIGLLLCSVLFCGESTITLNYSPADFTVRADNEFVHIIMDGGIIIGSAGEPEILTVPVHILLPPGENAIGVKNIDVEYDKLANDILLAPFSPPVIRPMPGISQNISPTEPNPEIYSQNKWFPQNSVDFAGNGNLSGYSIAELIIKPIRYNPITKEVEYIRSLTITVEHLPGKILAPAVRSPRSKQIFENIVRRLVNNPQCLNFYSAVQPMDVGAKDYLIIAPDETWATEDTLFRLRLSIRRQGWNDTLITATEIDASYSGIDLPEKIRNCIKSVWESDGIASVLLVGDESLLDVRHTFAMDCEAGFYEDENDIPCDLYFSDLDGNWNANGNDIFGEISDSVDLYTDVLVGRVSVDDLSEFSGWLGKYITYVENTPGGFGAEALFLGQILWYSPYTDGGESKDMVRDEALPEHFSLLRLYESLGNENIGTVTNALNAGYGVINHDGHASYGSMGVGGYDYFTNDDADALFNYPYCGVLYSIGCWPAAFDYNCIAEHFFTNPDGGVVAFVGNSRYGWGSPGNAGYGYSDYFDREFWKRVFSGQPRIGSAIAETKAYFAPYSHWENVWRWKQYELTILGEPGMIIWQDEPTFVSMDIPEALPTDGGFIPVNYTGEFVVSANQDGEILNRQSAYGSFSFWVEPITESPVEIAVFDPTGWNMLTIDTIFVAGDRPYICLDYFTPETVRAGNTYNITFYLRNCGTADGAFEYSPEIISGGTIDYIGTAPDTLTVGDTFSVSIQITADDTLKNGDLIRGKLDCTCGDFEFPIPFGIRTIAPVIDVVVMYFEGDYSGNALLWDDTYPAHALIQNTSDATFDGTISFDCAEYGFSGAVDAVLIPGTTSVSLGEFTIPEGTSPVTKPINFHFGSLYQDTFWVSILRGDFFDDAETGDYFSTSGNWRRTTDYSISGIHSYRCADASGNYPNNANDWLVSDTIIIGEDATLSFWMRYEVTTYGSDGLHTNIIALDSGDTLHLDYVGSGGALPLLGFETGWTIWEYDIPLPPQTPIKIAFNFTSDGEDNAPGVFLDDIQVSWKPTVVDTSAGISQQTRKPVSADIEIYPNPFNSTCKIEINSDFDLTGIKIYDIYGRIVNSYNPVGNQRTLLWDVENLPSGLYLIRATTENGTTSRKVILER